MVSRKSHLRAFKSFEKKGHGISQVPLVGHLKILKKKMKKYLASPSCGVQ